MQTDKSTLSSPSILVFGRGYLAERFSRYFAQQAVRLDTNITDLVELEEALQKYRPSLIINAAGKTNTSQIEKPENRALAYQVNVQGAANLAYLAQREGIRLVQLSSGMPFDGSGPQGDGWRETDMPCPTCYYAWTKAWSDWQLYPFLERDRILIIRLHLPASVEIHPRNYLSKLQKFSQFCTEASSVTVVEDLLTAVEQLLKQQATGIYHVVNPGKISAYRIAELLQEYGWIEAERSLQALSRAELDQRTTDQQAAKQSFPILNTDKLEAAGIHLPEIETAIRHCLQQYHQPEP